jgi:outer membrane protein TolC
MHQSFGFCAGHRLIGCMSFLMILIAMSVVCGHEPARIVEPAPHLSPVPLKFSLEQAKLLSLEKQPAILAARASLNGSITQQNTANSFLAMFSGPQIHVRRKQAEAGVGIAAANINQIEMETLNAVTRTYLSVMFAKEQFKIAEQTEKEFGVIYQYAKDLVDKGSKEVTAADRDRVNTYRLLAQTRVSTARMRLAQARAALREAIGLPHTQPIDIAEESLSDYYQKVIEHLKKENADFSCDCAVDMAVRHRPEVAQALLFAELARLEIDAQGLTMRSRAPTFAATGDIHSKILPPSMNDETYRPGPVGPEYPVELAGSHSQRRARAVDLYDRANQVADKVKGLIALEVEAACIGLKEQKNQVDILTAAVKETDKLAREARDAYKNDLLKTEVMLGAQVLDAQTKAQLNEAYYLYSVSLAQLHRATNGRLWECLEKKK